jgi:YbaB/EbfC DNA-binding family protein
MFDGDDLDAAERRVDEWQAGLERRAGEAREMAARLAGLSASARSADELVTVTVDADGVTRLELEEGIRKQPASETAAAILATIRVARGKLTEAVTSVAAETVGVDSETGKAVIAAYAKRNG